MNETIIGKAREFLIDYLRGKTIGYETIHPWHREWKHTVLHSFRVEEYVKQIIEIDNTRLDEQKVIITRLAAILHDIGRFDNRKEHEKTGMAIVEKWIDSNQNQDINYDEKNELLQIILDHTRKDGKETNYEKAILKDSDALDEIGMMSIFMAGNQIKREDAFYFNRLFERIKGYEINYCKKVLKNLNTEPGRMILKKKLEFMNVVIKQLKSEIIGTNGYENQLQK